MDGLCGVNERECVLCKVGRGWADWVQEQGSGFVLCCVVLCCVVSCCAVLCCAVRWVMARGPWAKGDGRWGMAHAAMGKGMACIVVGVRFVGGNVVLGELCVEGGSMVVGLCGVGLYDWPWRGWPF